jgi:hypothetical protein
MSRLRTLLAPAFVILCMSAVYARQAPPFLAANTWATDDEVAYLELAAEAHALGGPLGLVGALLRGEFEETARGPFYIGLLSSFVTRSLVGFDRARAFNFWLGLTMLALLTALIGHAYGWPAGLFVGLAMAANPSYLSHVALTTAEVVFVPLVGVTLVVLAHGLGERARRPEGWLIAGCALIGVSYLTKNNGLFLLPALLAALAVDRWGQHSAGRARWRWRHLALGLGALLLICAPLLIRNWRLFGSPLFNRNTPLLWLSDYEASRSQEFRTYGATLADYLSEHTLADMAARLGDGTRRQLELVAQMLGAPLGSDTTGYGMLALALLGVLFIGSYAQRALYGLSFLGFLAFFAWMTPVWFSPHYMMPMLPAAFLSAWLTVAAAWRRACAISLLARWRQPQQWIPSSGVTLALIAGVVVAAGALAWSVTHFTLPPAREKPEVAALRAWIAAHIAPDESYILGPEREFRYEWYVDLPGLRRSVPAMNSFAELQAYMDERNVDWLLVTPRQYARRQAVFEDYILYHEPYRFVYARPLPGWRLVDWDRQGDTVDYLIYRRDPQAPPDFHLFNAQTGRRFLLPTAAELGQPLDANFGGRIALRGFAVAQERAAAGGAVAVRLTWQRMARMATMYTAFVHLVPAARQPILGQEDRPPTPPTTEWLLDEVVSEEYRFVVAPEAGAGRYWLEVGWYDPISGERLPLLDKSGQVIDNSLLLPVPIEVVR